MSKPTIIIVPGAWHTPTHLEGLIKRLRDGGYPVVSKQLGSVGSDDPKNQTAATDAKGIREGLLLPEIDQGKDVILVLHSYAGSPGSAAAKGLSKAERTAAGKKGSVIGLVFLCAFLAAEGDSLQSKLPEGKLAPWQLVNEETGTMDVDKPEEILYNKIEASVARNAIQAMQKHATSSFCTPSPSPAWPDEGFNGRRAYVKCQQDNAIPYVGQDMMVSLSGVDWKVLDLEDADHSPFLSHIEPIYKFIDEAAQEWSA